MPDTASLDAAPKVTTGPLPGSRKIYVEGSRPDIRVAMREIDLEPSSGEAPVRVYDCSGPFTDPAMVVDINKGVPALRAQWILERSDVEHYEGRAHRPEDDGLKEGETITVTPMRAFPIIRDLVTDVSFNYEQARKVPAFNPPPRPEDGYRMSQVDVERGQEFRKCIECFMCQDVCHVIRDHEENKARYSGPRFFIRYAELEMHPLDTNDRRDLVREEMGLGMCNITKCCTEVCPEHIKITDNAIIPLKERVVDADYDPIAWLGRKILRRTKRTAEQAAVQPD